MEYLFFYLNKENKLNNGRNQEMERQSNKISQERVEYEEMFK